MPATCTATARHRRILLAIALAAAVSYPVGRWFAIPGNPDLDDLLVFGLVAVGLISLLLLIVAWLAERPAAFVVRPELPAFGTPASGMVVYATLLITFIASGQVGSLVASIKSHDLWLSDAVFAVLWILVAGLYVPVAWHGLSVYLRPEGLWWREPTGSVRVPWEALGPGYPLRPAVRVTTLALSYARPDLVRRRGLVLDQQRLRIDNVHAWFIADAIRHYVAHPEHRAAIGTQAEYRRLLQAIGAPIPPTRPERTNNS